MSSTTSKQPKGCDGDARIVYFIKAVEELAKTGTQVPAFVPEVYTLLTTIRVHLLLLCNERHLAHVYLGLVGR